MHLLRRAQMKYSIVFFSWGGGENDSLAVCVHCVVFKWWCRSSVWMVRDPVQWIPHAGAGVEQPMGSGEKAATARLSSSESSGQQCWHSFSSVNVSQKANISKVILRNCRLRTHWAMCDPAGAGLHQEEQLVPNSSCDTTDRAASSLALQPCHSSNVVNQVWNLSSEKLLEALWVGHKPEWMTDSLCDTPGAQPQQRAHKLRGQTGFKLFSQQSFKWTQAPSPRHSWL